jgi:hypothetical protein
MPRPTMSAAAACTDKSKKGFELSPYASASAITDYWS